GVLPAVVIERVLHAVDLRGLVQAAHVRVEAEERRAAPGLVAACALEDDGAVVNHVRGNVNGRILPVDQRAVHSDLACLGESHGISWSDFTRFAASDGVGAPREAPLLRLPAERAAMRTRVQRLPAVPAETGLR